MSVSAEEQHDDLIVCPDCGLVQRRVPLPARGSASCRRCHSLLYRQGVLDLGARLALALAGVIVFCLANSFPIVTLQAQGSSNATTLLGTVQALWQQHMEPVSVLVLFTAFMVPALELSVLSYLLFPLYLKRVPPGFEPLLRLMRVIRPWGMAEVFLIGVLVALVKLGHLAVVEPGTGLWSFAALIVLLALNAGSFDSQGLWRHYRNLRPR